VGSTLHQDLGRTIWNAIDSEARGNWGLLALWYSSYVSRDRGVAVAYHHLAFLGVWTG